MSWKSLFFTMALLSTVASAHAQETPDQTIKQHKSGESILLNGRNGIVKLKVSTGTNPKLVEVGVKGAPLIAILEFDAGGSTGVLRFYPDEDAEKSRISLILAGEKISPPALQVLMPNDPDDSVWYTNRLISIPAGTRYFALIGKKATIYLLFDVPTDKLKESKKLLLDFDLGEKFPQKLLINLDK